MKVLIVVDMQNDFVDGALGTPEAPSVSHEKVLLSRYLERLVQERVHSSNR